ncbi:hypothetical protein BSKO_01614 [Bryopsis sp. KO-2023]|nr:hypothetical protein BSKO_01614 [Bryopsis sp. KO-2023]
MQTPHPLHSRSPNIPIAKTLGVQSHGRLRWASTGVWKSSRRTMQFPRRLFRGGLKAVDSDDYFHDDPDAFDVDDYDECVLGSGALRDRQASPDLADACLSGLEGSCRVAFDESGRAGKKMAKSASKRLKKTVRNVVGDKNVESFKRSVDDLPEGWLARIFWFWEQPFMKIGRLTMFFARLPAVWALAFTQFGFFAGQLTLPMLPPLLLGAGMLMRTIWVNANFIFPRIYLIVILLWITWFANSLVQKTILYLRRQGTLDSGFATTLITCTECTAILIAGVVILSMSGVNVSGLFLPAGICFALAAKDLSHNFLAGIFLFLVQPFRMGDKVSVQSTAPGSDGGNWFQGRCEKVDLRYTTLRKGSYRLFIPNKSFITNEFVVMDPPGREMLGLEDGHLWDNMPGTNIDDLSWPDASDWSSRSEQSQVPMGQPLNFREHPSLVSPPSGRDPDFLRNPWTPEQPSSTNGHSSHSHAQGRQESGHSFHSARASPSHSQEEVEKRGEGGPKHDYGAHPHYEGTSLSHAQEKEMGSCTEASSSFREDKPSKPKDGESAFPQGDILSYSQPELEKKRGIVKNDTSGGHGDGEQSLSGGPLLSHGQGKQWEFSEEGSPGEVKVRDILERTATGKSKKDDEMGD